MRSRMNPTITRGQVCSWTLEFLLRVKLVKDHGWRCTAPAQGGLEASARCE